MPGPLTDKRVLVVEDEAYIAFDLRQALAAAGAVVLGPVPDAAAATALVNSQAIDAAVLDVNLGGEASFPLAEALAGKSVPYMFLTGYDGWSLPERHRATARLGKPFTMSKVMQMVEQLCTAKRA